MFGKLFGWGRRPASVSSAHRGAAIARTSRRSRERVLLSTFTWDMTGTASSTTRPTGWTK